MTPLQGLSRRRVFKAAAAATVTSALVIEATFAAPTAIPQARVAATIVRIGPSRSSANGLRFGLRLSIVEPAERRSDRVVVIDPIDFDLSGDELRRQLVVRIQQRVQEVLAHQEIEVSPDRIAVHVFGGPL